MPAPTLSYPIAATQRSGSTLLCRALEDTGVTGLDRAATFHALFPDVHVIRLTGRDRVAQAVSWARAAQDGVWVISDAEPAAPNREPAYSYQFVAGLEGLLVEAERGWLELCAELGVTPLEIAYEDLANPATYPETLRSALRHLGVESHRIVIPEPRTHRQANATSDAWVQQYESDRATTGEG